MTSTPKPTLSVADATAAEGDALTFTVTLTLSDVPNGDVRVTWTASVESGDTATEADLGSPTTGRAYIASGQTTGTFTVGTLKDATEERDETFTVTLSDPASNAQLATVATATGTIIDDLPADTTTTGQVVGGSVASNIGTGTDKDWFAVVLAADRRYQIDLEGADTGRGTLADPALELFDAAGTSLSASDDDGGVGRNARLIYTPSAAGAYYAQASDAAGSTGGTYTLSMIVLGANGVSKADTDFAADTSTSGRVEVGGSVTGTLTAANVVDSFAVDLEAGRRYRIDLEGADTNRGTLPDPVLWKILAPGDNLIYEKGTGRTGTYTLSVRDLAVIPAALPTLSIDDASGTEADGVQFTVTLSATTTAEVTVDWTASIGSGDTAVAADLGSTTTGTATVAASATTTTFTVATADDTDAETDETFTVTLSNPSANAELGTMSTATGTIADDNADTALAGIAVNGTGIPAFLATDFAPQHGVSATTTTAAMVATAASPSATVSYSGTDADISTMDVHDVMLSNGANTVAVADKGKSAAYHLGVNRAVTADYGWKADSDFDTLKRAVNNDPRGIWYDGATATFYVSDFRDDKVYAYNTDGTRDTGKDIPVSNYPNGIWSDGTTLWVADSGPDKLFAYTLSSRAANSDEDFDTLDAAGNDDPRGLWSHGSILWATDSDDDKLYAYNLPATMTPTNNAPAFANATETRTVPETGAAVTRYAHTGLSAGETRHYRVYAVNAEGESPASSVVDATTEEEREPEGNEPSVIRTYWIGSGGSNDKSGCAGTEEFRAYWNPPLESNRTCKVADAWEADITLRGGAGDLDYTIQDSGGNPEHPELTGSVRIDGNGWLSMRVRGRFGADGWGGWSPTSSLYCWAASARVDGPLLALTWPTPRDGFAAPDGGDFAVRADGAAVAVTGAALVGRHALLTLGAPALPGQSVSVDYLGSAMHPLADADGVPVPAWTDLPAENLTGAPEDAQWAAVVALAEARRTAAGGRPALAAHGADPTSLSLAGAGLTDADLVALWWSGGPRPDRRDAPDAGPRRPETRPVDVFALAGLRRLDLSGNRLADVSLPADRRGLESLDLSGNALTDIAPLSTLTALRRLDLRGNRVADLAPLASLPRLEVLLLDGNRIVDAGALTHLGTLRHLGLADNAVADFAPLSDLWSLRRLDLGGNPATDLSPLGDLETLEWLRVPAANGVPAHRLIRLRWLWTGPVGICLGCGDGMR